MSAILISVSFDADAMHLDVVAKPTVDVLAADGRFHEAAALMAFYERSRPRLNARRCDPFVPGEGEQEVATMLRQVAESVTADSGVEFEVLVAPTPPQR